MDYEVMTKQQEKTAQRLQLRRIVSAVSILIGFSGIVLAAVLSTQQTTVSNNLPQYEPLREGTYVPAQVVFKVKKGKSAEVALKNLLAKKQTLYQKKSDRTFLPLSEAKQVENNPAYEKKTITLHKKSAQQLFTKLQLSDAVRQKILSRPGALDPEESYNRLGLDRWYVATVEERYADVAQMVRNLKQDSDNIESVSPNRISKLRQTPNESADSLRAIEEEPSSLVGDTTSTTTCENPNDPYSCTFGHVYPGIGDQWWLDATDIRGAWPMTKGDSKTIIAVVDSGVDTYHTDLKEKIWLNVGEDINGNSCADYWGQNDYGSHTDCHGNIVTSGGDINNWDDDRNGYIDDVNGMDMVYESEHFRQNNPQQGPADVLGHGTAVAGIIAASTNTSVAEGVAGACPLCTIMPIRVGSSGGDVFQDSAAKGIIYATLNGADVINMSFGGEENQAEWDAIAYANSVGAVLVVSSGNDNSEITQDEIANDQRIIAVGATDYTENRMYLPIGQKCQNQYSGQMTGSGWGDNISIVAPGVNVMTTMGFSDIGTMLCMMESCHVPSVDQVCGIAQASAANRSGYFYHSGTSFSAPIVSGIVGLMLSLNPAIPNDDMKSILETSATPIDTPIDENGQDMYYGDGWNPYTGFGVVNAEAAVREAYNRRPDFGITITPGTTPIVAVDVNKIRYDIWVENRGWTTATRVPYKVVNADTNETVYSGVTPTLYGNIGGWLNETVTLSTVPARVKVILDPENLYSEPFENDNSSQIINVKAYGTPYFNHQERQEVTLGSSVVFQVSATDVNTPADQLTYDASNLPTNASFANKTFTWTPDAALSSGTYYPVFSVSDTDGLQSALAVPIQYNNPSAATYANLQATMATFDEVNVTWTTNALTDSSIEYGLTTAYGERLYDSVPALDHSLAFRVEPGQTYHYKIISCTTSVNRACVTSGDRVYQAPAIPVATLSNVRVTVNKDRWPYLLTTVWDTDIPTNGQMNWGIGNTDTRTVDDAISTTHHETSVVAQPNTTYQVTVSSCTNQPSYYQRCLESPVTSITVPPVTSPPTPKVSVSNNVAVIAWSCLEQPTAGTVQLFLNGQLIASQNYSGTNNSVSFPVQPSTSYTYHVRGTNSGYWCSDMAGLSFSSPSNNQPPIIPTLSSVTAYRGTLFSYQFPVATDPEGKALSYAVSGLPPGATYDIETRKITWLLGTNKTYLSSYAVQYISTDADGGSATATLKISVQTYSSFLPGTPIRLATGRLITVEDVRGGEEVHTYNPDTKRWGVGTIDKTFAYEAEEFYTLNATLRVTAHHPVLTARGWVTVRDLRIGDRLKTNDGYRALVSKQLTRQPVRVYNLEVSGDHTYLADGIVVHNKRNPYIQSGL